MHQCVRCGIIYEDGSEVILKGCKCGSRFFFFVNKAKIEKMKKLTVNLDDNERKRIEVDVKDMVGEILDDKPVILDLENVRVLKPGQYRGSHKLRLHSGKYLALGQKEPVTVYRDNNRNDMYEFDESTCDTGVFGINIHRATARTHGESIRVDKWSAGCQVIAANDDFKEFMEIVNQAKVIHGNSFSYTLIESADIKT